MSKLNQLKASRDLDEIDRTQKNIRAHGAKEYTPWFGWGLYVLFFYSPFDFLNGSLLGPIFLAVSIVGMFITYFYFRNSRVRLHAAISTPWYIGIVAGTFTAA